MGWFVLIVLTIGVGFWFFGTVILSTAAVVFSALLAASAVALTFGTAPFWLLVTVATLFVAWCVSDGDSDLKDDYDEVWSGTAIVTVLLFSVIVALVNLKLFSFNDYSVFSTCLLIAGSFMAYLFIGGLWSIFRFDRFGTHRQAEIEAWKKERLDRFALLGLSTERAIAECIKEGLADNRAEGYESRRYNYNEATSYRKRLEAMISAARPRNNMNRIMTWIGLWPWSVIAWVLRDPVKFVYDLLIRVYDASYNRTVGKLDNQFKTVFSDDSTD